MCFPPGHSRQSLSTHRPRGDGQRTAHTQLAGAEGLEGRVGAQHQHLEQKRQGRLMGFDE